jgi:hypothetical protein
MAEARRSPIWITLSSLAATALSGVKRGSPAPIEPHPTHGHRLAVEHDRVRQRGDGALVTSES